MSVLRLTHVRFAYSRIGHEELAHLVIGILVYFEEDLPSAVAVTLKA
jgi:hypothetical protein